MWLGIILILLSMRLLYETFKYKTETTAGMKLQYKKFLLFFSAVLYAFLLRKIGYVISTFIFLLIAFQTMERGRLLPIHSSLQRHFHLVFIICLRNFLADHCQDSLYFSEKGVKL